MLWRMADFQLAQVNIARLAAPLDSPQLADFVAHLPQINAVADQAPGFVWRMTDADGADSTGLRLDGQDDMWIINCSVWESVEALHAYTYRTDHLRVMSRRREWFRPLGAAHQALWWVPAGHRPSVAEEMERIDLIREHGPGPDAFTFAKPHPAPSPMPGAASASAAR